MQTASSALSAEQAARPQEHGDVVCVTRPGTSRMHNLPCAQKATGAASADIVTLAPGATKKKKEQLLKTLGGRQPANSAEASATRCRSGVVLARSNCALLIVRAFPPHLCTYGEVPGP